MNVLHVNDQREWGGGEQQTAYLAEGLVALGHRVTLAARPDGALYAALSDSKDLTCCPVTLGGEWDLRSAWRLSRIVLNSEIDIIHAHTGHAHTLACLARRLAGRGRVIVSRRVAFPPRGNVLSRFKYRCPDRYIAISGCVEQSLRAFGVPEDKVVVVHSGIDMQRFPAQPLSRAEFGVPEDVPLVGAVGALVEAKDHATLLSAMRRVVDTEPLVRLVIAGEGPLRAQLEAQILQLGLKDNVLLLGHRQDIPQLLASLDVFAMSSVSEGLGTSVLDALASGLPVVATAAGGIPEMIRNNETGILIPTGDPDAMAEGLLRVLRDRALGREMAERGKSLVAEKFTVQSMVRGTAEVYKAILDKWRRNAKVNPAVRASGKDPGR